MKSNQLLSLCLHFLCYQRKVFPKMTVHLSTLCLQSLILPDTCPRANFSKEAALILKLTFNDAHISKGQILKIPNFWCHLHKFIEGHRQQDLKKK